MSTSMPKDLSQDTSENLEGQEVPEDLRAILIESEETFGATEEEIFPENEIQDSLDEAVMSADIEVFEGAQEEQFESNEESEPSIGEYIWGADISEEVLDEVAEPFSEEEPPHIGESDMVHSHESDFPTETDDIEDSYLPTIDEESIDLLGPLVQDSLEKTLEAVVPSMVQRVESALVQSIHRRTEELIVQQLPEVVDRIVNREVEKYQ